MATDALNDEDDEGLFMVALTSDRGRTCIANEPIPANTCVLWERPLLCVPMITSLQTPRGNYSTSALPRCAQCGQPGKPRIPILPALPDDLRQRVQATEFGDSVASGLKFFSERGDLGVDSWVDDFDSSEVFCPFGCNQTFCSARCGDTAFRSWHRALCPVALTLTSSTQQQQQQQHPMKHAKVDKLAADDLGVDEAAATAALRELENANYQIDNADFSAIFQLLLRCCAFLATRKLMDTADDTCADEGLEDGSTAPLLDQFCSADWETVCCAFGARQFAGGPEAWCIARSTLLDRFISSVRCSPYVLHLHSQIGDRATLSRLLGMLTQNTAERTPCGAHQHLVDVVEDLARTGDASAFRWLDQSASVIESLNTWWKCIAIFRSHSCFNHSCDPNCVVRNPGPNYLALAERTAILFDASAVIVSLRDVSAGEELTISYIHGNDITAFERQSLLQDHYNFTCTCSRCVVDD